MKARTQLLVLKPFQRWFLRTFVLYTAAFLGVFGIGLFFWFRLMIRELNHVAGLLSDTFRMTIDRHIILGVWATAVFVFILLCVAALQALLFSRRIAGPLFALSRHLDRCLEQGRMEPLKLRNDDFFVDVADKFNALSEKVNSRNAS